MDGGIALVVLIILAVPLIVGSWLIIRAVSARDQIEDLTRRVDDLQLEVARLKQSAPAPARTMAEKVAGFSPATLPPRKEEPFREAEKAPVAPPPLAGPSIQELFAASMAAEAPEAGARRSEPVADVPAAEAAFEPAASAPADLEPPVIPPPPIVPPLPPLPSELPEPAVARGEPEPEPVEEQARMAEPSTPEPEPEKASFEMRVGSFWVVRVAVVILLAGLGLAANLAYRNIIPKLGPWEKVSLLYLASGLLLAGGAWWQRRGVKASLKNYAQVLFAGGLAAVYFTTYAAHYAPPVRVISSALLDGTLLFLWAGVMAWIADRRQSEVMALFAVCLAFFTSVITRVGEFTLYSNLVLTIAAVVFLVRNRWAGLSFVSLVTSYAGYAFWRFLQDNGWHWASAADETLRLGAGFLAAYWVVFTAAAFLSKNNKLTGQARAAFVTLNNGAYFSLFLLTMLQVHTGGFWKFSLGYGGVLLTMALLAGKFLAAEPLTKNTFLTQGLLLVTLGFISKFAGLQLALVLATESVVLYVLATQRRSLVLKIFAYASAAAAAGWCMTSLAPFDAAGLWIGIATGAILMVNAVRAHRAGADDAQLLRPEPAVWVVLAFIPWLAVTWFNTTPEHLPLALAAEAVMLTFSIHLLRVREITVLGQGFLMLAQLACVWQLLASTPPWWNPLAVMAVTIGLSHWWQHQKSVAASRNLVAGCTGLFALAVVAVALLWLHPRVSAPAWLALTSLLAVAVTGYGLLTRAWALAVCGQIFLAVSVGEFWRQVPHEQPEWYFALVPLAVLLSLSAATLAWFGRQTGEPSAVRAPLLQVALVYRWLALAMSLLWLWEYVPERQRAWVSVPVSAAVFALAVWRSSREALAASAVYAAAALALLWGRDGLVMEVYWPNLLALLALPVLQQILRRRSAQLPLEETVHGVVVLVSGVSLWRFLSCWAAQVSGGFTVTMTWAGFALLMFGAGIVLNERFLRWSGLGVLTAAVGRVILVDVWTQQPGYRVLTFLALGVALLVVGFVYNKYQEKIRRWL